MSLKPTSSSHEEHLEPRACYTALFTIKLNKVAIEIIEHNKINLDVEISDSQHDIVRKFIIYWFKLAEKSHSWVKSLKTYLNIIAMLPNRYKLIKMLQNLKGRKLEEGGLIVWMIKLNEIRYYYKNYSAPKNSHFSIHLLNLFYYQVLLFSSWVVIFFYLKFTNYLDTNWLSPRYLRNMLIKYFQIYSRCLKFLIQVYTNNT